MIDREALIHIIGAIDYDIQKEYLNPENEHCPNIEDLKEELESFGISITYKLDI